MAIFARPSTVSDQYKILEGSQPTMVFDMQLLRGPSFLAPAQYGSPVGVPPAASIAGQTEQSGTSGAAYASSVSMRGAASHPILWLIILMVIGLLGLGLIAHLEVKRRG